MHVHTVGDDGQAALTGSHLHGDKEEEVGKQGDEGLHQYTVPERYIGGEDEQDELNLETAHQTGEELQTQT